MKFCCISKENINRQQIKPTEQQKKISEMKTITILSMEVNNLYEYFFNYFFTLGNLVLQKEEKI